MAIMLLLAIIGVVAYIAVRFFAAPVVQDSTVPTSNLGTDIPLKCTELTLDEYQYEFTTNVGRMIIAHTKPEKPSDPIKYEDYDETIITVSDKGLITPISNGSTTIKVSCGDQVKYFEVVVNFAEQGSTPDVDNPDIDAPDQSDKPASDELRLLYSETRLIGKGQVSILYNGSIPVDQITWSSDDNNIATFADGKATAVGEGTTTVYAEYNGKKVSCKIICDFDTNSGVEGNGGVSEDGGGSSSNAVTGTIYNVQKDCNLRKGPGLSFEVVGTINLNTRVTISEQKIADGKTWGKIDTEKWVSMEFVKLD